MRRRRFLLAAVAVSTSLAAGISAVTSVQSSSDGVVDYQPGAIKEALDTGKAVLVDYYAPWCGACRAQERVVDALRAEQPIYDEKIIFIRVDWDTYRSEPVSTDRDVPRRSTLILLKGEDEIGRLVADTRPQAIKALLDQGL